MAILVAAGIMAASSLSANAASRDGNGPPWCLNGPNGPQTVDLGNYLDFFGPGKSIDPAALYQAVQHGGQLWIEYSSTGSVAILAAPNSPPTVGDAAGDGGTLTAVVPATVTAGACGSSGATTTSASTTTETATTVRRLPPPYNQKPSWQGGGECRPQPFVYRAGQIMKCTWLFGGVVKILQIHLVKIFPQLVLLRKGTTPFHMTNLGPSWTYTNIHDQYHKLYKFTYSMQVRRNAKPGRACYVLDFKIANGALRNESKYRSCQIVIKR